MGDHARVGLAGLSGGVLEIPVTEDLLRRLGGCLVDSFIKESKKEFAKRGWSGKAPDGSKPIWESFSYRVTKDSVEVLSSHPYVEEMVSQDRDRGRMRWLTQEAKERNPSAFPLTPREMELGMRRGGRVSKGERLPLIVPIKDNGGRVVFRTAPLRLQDAWVHPGIARFTFVEKAMEEGRRACLEIIKEEAIKALISSLENA